MKTKIILTLQIFIILISCTNKKSTDTFVQINSSILASNTLISSVIRFEHNRLNNYLNNSCTIEKAQIWFPKADTTKKMGEDLINEIELTKENVKSKFTKDIIEKIMFFQNTVLNLDKGINKIFFKDSIVTYALNKVFLNNTFYNKNLEEQISLLSTLQNRILLFENKIITYCSNQISTCCFLNFDNSSVIVSQNSTHLKPGEYLEITAGIGSFSNEANAEITFNGSTIPTENGVSRYKMKVNNNIGENILPVKIDYRKQNGERISESINVKYFIGE